MTCGGCVARVKKALESLPGVQDTHVQLETPQLSLVMDPSLSFGTIQKVVMEAGHYTVSEIAPSNEEPPAAVKDFIDQRGFFATYKPLWLIVGLLMLVTASLEIENGDVMRWMRHFMAGFFLVFSFFKLLNVQGFAASYRMYDWIAGVWPGWGYVYPFVELALGMAYLLNIAPVFTHSVTLVLMILGAGSVIQSNLSKKKIQCACLGDVFDLPMSFVTIVEDVLMALMAAVMLYWA